MKTISKINLPFLTSCDFFRTIEETLCNQITLIYGLGLETTN
jgi:hypothetical protein